MDLPGRSPLDKHSRYVGFSRVKCKTLPGAGCLLSFASLADIIASKRAAARPRDEAVLEILETTLREKIKAASKT